MLKKIKTILILLLSAAVAYLLFQGSTVLDGKLENKPTPWVDNTPDTVAPEASATPKLDESQALIVEARRDANAKMAEALSTGLYETYPPLIVDDSPEASNRDYSWLKHMVENESYPDIKAHVNEAFNNDGIIRETENSEIISRSVDWNEREDAGEKGKLRELVK